MRRMTNEKARKTNGGYTIWKCSVCGWKIATGLAYQVFGSNGYFVKPLRCPHGPHYAKWKKVSG